MREFLHSFSRLELDKVKQRIQNYTLSPRGGEHVETLAPSADLEEVRHSLAGVSEMKRLLETDDYPPLENVFDIRTSLSRASIENYILSSAELHQIALVLSTSEKIRSYFARRQQLYPVMWRIVNAIQPDKVLGYNIGKAIDDEGNVKDSASKVLSSIRAQIVDKKHSLRRNLESILKSIAEKEWAQEEIITTREGRMVIPVKSEHKNRIPGFIHSSSSSGATVFIEPTVTLELNNEIRTLEFEERREIEKILKGLTEQVRGSRDLLRTNIHSLGELDFIQAKAKYSIEILGGVAGHRRRQGFRRRERLRRAAQMVGAHGRQRRLHQPRRHGLPRRRVRGQHSAGQKPAPAAPPLRGAGLYSRRARRDDDVAGERTEAELRVAEGEPLRRSAERVLSAFQRPGGPRGAHDRGHIRAARLQSVSFRRLRHEQRLHLRRQIQRRRRLFRRPRAALQGPRARNEFRRRRRQHRAGCMARARQGQPDDLLRDGREHDRSEERRVG